MNSETFIETIRSINTLDPKESEKVALIEEILKDESFLKLIKDIMISDVMKNVYILMNEYYFSNGNLSQDEEMKILKNNKIPNPEYNFIDDKPIISYYNKFCKELKKFDNKSNFIIMGLPKTIKGFTFRFLKIVINSKGIILNMNEISKFTLLKAYLIFVLINGQNHFMKRHFNINSVINGDNEGGLIKLLFGEEMIHRNLNLEQAKYILDINNWTTKSIYEFKKDFQSIQVDGNKDNIVYLTSEYYSERDHSKLHI